MKLTVALSAILILTLNVPASEPSQFTLENNSLARTITIDHGILRTTQIVNKRAGTIARPAASPEFQIRIGPDDAHPATLLTASNFQVTAAALSTNSDGRSLNVTLANTNRGLRLKIDYDLKDRDFFMRKYLVIEDEKTIPLERVDVEALALDDAYQPYTTREITSRAPGRWNPGLGQPLYTSRSGIFFGIEFPAADNSVKDGLLCAGYLRGRTLTADSPYPCYPAVMGVTDDPKFITDTFFEYIDRIRARPLRLRVQYNSWFDYGSSVTETKFSSSVAKVNQELVIARHTPPLDAYTIDDGWEDAKTNWSDKVWKVNGKFDPDFASSVRA